MLQKHYQLLSKMSAEMVSIGRMARDQMESQLCHGRVVRFLFGMSHAQTPWHLLTHLWFQETLVPWPKRQNTRRLRSINLSPAHFFIPIAVETMGVFGPEARNFFRELARRIKSVTDDHMTHQYLVQRVSVIIQQGNAAAVLGCIGEGSVV